MSEEFKALLQKAMEADEANNMEEMKDLLIKACSLQKVLSKGQRNALKYALTCVVGDLAISWKETPDQRKSIEKKQLESVKETVAVIDDLRLHCGDDHVAMLDYLRLKGSLCAKLVNLHSNTEYYNLAATSLYKAVTYSTEVLPPADYNRVMAHANYVQFLLDNTKDCVSAQDIARAAYNSALNHINEVDEAQVQDTTVAMQLLSDLLNRATEEVNTKLSQL